jgi:hypothetical protein
MRKLAFAGAAACALAFSARIAAAQSCSITTTAAIPPAQTCTITSTHSLTIPSLLSLTMSGFTSGTNETLVAPTAMSDFVTPTIQMSTVGPSYVVKANRNYKVQISANAAAFTGPYAKPAGDLAWATSLAGTYTGLTTTPVDLSSGGATASASGGVWYKTTYNFATDVPGSYTLDVTFTLVAP